MVSMSQFARRRIVWVAGLALAVAAAWMVYRRQTQLPVVVRVAGPSTPPFLNRGTDGKYFGPTVDLFERAAQRRGIRLQWVLPKPNLLQSIGHSYDLYLQVPNSERYRSRLYLSRPWIHSEYILFAKRESGSSLRKGGSGLKIAIPEFGFPEELVQQFLFDGEVKKIRSVREGLSLVCQGLADVSVATARVAPPLLLDRPTECASVPLDWISIPNGRIEVSIGAAPGFERAADALRSELGAMSLTGEIAQIYLPYANVGSDLSMFLNLGEATSQGLTSRLESGLLTLLALGLLAGLYWLGKARREAERLTQEANSASQAKSDFVAMISHELRTPVHGFAGMTSLLLDSPLEPGQRELAVAALDAAGHLQNLLNDVLDLAKIEAGKFPIANEPFDLQGLLESCLTSLGATLRDRPLALSLTGVQDCPKWVLGDEKCLRQVIMNLGSNAIKFTESGAVDLSVLVESEDAFAHHVRIVVSDTGIGIRQDYLPRLFERFEQADGSHARRYGGTGLGLAIVKQLLRLMGTRIEVESALGRGSRFHFALRLPRAHAPAPALALALPNDLSGYVLVAEDNPVNQRVVTRFLERLGIQYVVAADGEQATRAFAAQHFDLILMDCQMPTMDGFEAARRIRALSKGRDIPIIALSANASTEDQILCLNAGMNDFLAKPFQLSHFASVLARWMPRKSLSATA